MALSLELKVYKDSYDLLLHLYQISVNFNKDFKYTLGEKIKNEALEILINIYQANSDFSERKNNLKLAQDRIEKIIIYIRILKDLKQINLKKFVFLNEKIENINRQLISWKKKS
ncbi:MAG: four helix bundle protein [Patescibacteria group bacterium]|nr:four helix bundle protein [Patescibacteria group bacterium]